MYYLELTDNELKNLAGILGNFIGKNESNKDTKELVESARNKLCELLMNIQHWFWNRFGTPKQFTIVILKRL